MLLLKEHILIQDFRLVEMLREVDTDGKLAVTREQFDSVLKVSYCEFLPCLINLSFSFP